MGEGVECVIFHNTELPCSVGGRFGRFLTLGVSVRCRQCVYVCMCVCV